MSETIGVFVAWPYANGDLHLGHIAGAYLPADIFARYHRLKGNRVMMVSGSDAHGTPITLKAKEENLTPFEVVMRYHERFLQGWQKLGISFDLFTHTHTKNHQQTTQRIFTKLRDQGDLKVGTQQQFFDEAAGMFLPDRYVHGTCPICGNTRARGDQCEACGSTYEARELLNPVSGISNTAPVLKDTEHYFFQLQHYQEQILNYVNANPHWRTHVQNFTRAMIEKGLQPRAITRDIDWGVSVPEAGWEDKVIYVWFDAVIGYLSASLEWSARAAEQGDAWKGWWQDKSARSYYFIGKDNIPFHTVIWPIELMAYDPALNLPFDVPANQFLNIEGEKFSTSRGLAVWLLEVLDNFDVDPVRYYLTGIMPETKDANFSWEEFVTRNNGELVAAWGNLVNRVLSFAHGRYEGKIPEPQPFDELDQAMLNQIDEAFSVVGAHYEKVQLRDALKEAMALARSVNRYLDEKAPWTVFKQDPKKAGTAVFVAMRAIDSLKILLAPVLPNSARAIHEFFGYSEPLFGPIEIENYQGDGEKYQRLCYRSTAQEKGEIDRWKPSQLQPGTPFLKPTPLYKVLEAS